MLLITGASCSEATGDVFSVNGIVQGTVRQDAGDPVPEAWVVLEGTYPLSNGSTEALYDSVQTDGSGRYVGEVGVQNLPDTVALLTVRVWPPAGSGLSPAVRLDVEVPVTADLPPADTLVVDFSLEPT
jgi:hypothetical protein